LLDNFETQIANLKGGKKVILKVFGALEDSGYFKVDPLGWVERRVI
jgi:hypothetical protein